MLPRQLRTRWPQPLTWPQPFTSALILTLFPPPSFWFISFSPGYTGLQHCTCPSPTPRAPPAPLAEAPGSALSLITKTLCAVVPTHLCNFISHCLFPNKFPSSL